MVVFSLSILLLICLKKLPYKMFRQQPRQTTTTMSTLILYNARLCLSILMVSIFTIQSIGCSHQSIHLDQTGNYHGLIIGFGNNFQSFEQPNINTTIVSIMNQLQRTSFILKELMSVQIADVTIILPDQWHIDVNELQQSTSMQFDLRESRGQYRSLADADILYTNDDKNQILTMQYGDCGEGGMAINFPMQYVSDEYSARLLAHQWILYRYGVFNEFGLEDDYNYPVYYTAPDGGIRHGDVRPNINSCFQGSNAQFKYSNNCNNATDPNTGRPINPNCDVIPAKNSIQSSFMYAPIAVSEYRLCNSSTHDYQSPTKHNVLCDYQSIQDVIAKHTDFERFKPKFDRQNIDSNSSIPLIRFQILQNKNVLHDEHSVKANVLYALPRHGSKFLETSMDTIKKMAIQGFFPHQALFALYDDDQLQVVSGWRPSSQLSMIFFDDHQNEHRIKLLHIFEQMSQHFDQIPGAGTCVLFYSGDMLLENTDIDYIEKLADLLNRKNLRLQVILYDLPPSNEVLRFFDQLKSKLNSHSAVDYAFSQMDNSSSSIVAFRTQLTSIINTVLFDLLQVLTEQSHLLIKRETVRSVDPSGIDFTVDTTISHNDLLIEMTTNGKGSDLVMGFNLSEDFRNIIQFQTFEPYERSIVIHYQMIKAGKFRFNYRSSDPNRFITISVRVLSKQSLYHSYKDAILSARCWIQASQSNPLRGYVQVSQGLNGPVYDADVSFAARAITRTQQRQEITRPSNDNGRGNPDITAHDGIYSAYLDSLFVGNGDAYGAAYTIVAKISGHKIAIKPGNFGNTVMFNSKTRCCGTEVKTNSDLIESNSFERIVHCGSFYNSMQNEHHGGGMTNYAIRDLRIVNLNADNRSIALEWSSPFYYTNDHNKPIIIKAFHSYSRHSKLPLEIKQAFDRDQNEAELQIITDDDDANNHDDHNYSQLSVMTINEPQQTFENGQAHMMFDTLSSSQAPYARYESSSPSFPPNSFRPTSASNSNTVVTNSLRQVTIRILSPEEGFYLIAVKERNDDNESKPSNIVTVYLKTGPYRESGRGRALPWFQILIICIASAFVLFIIILIIICLTIRRYRRTNKETLNNDYKSSDGVVSNGGTIMNGDNKGDTMPTNKQSFYLTQDGNSLISNSLNDNTRMAPNSAASNHTSCSSVNTTVENGTTNHTSYLGHNHQNHQMPSHSIERQQQPEQSAMKELNVTTLLPNSWDAKELLDHWGRVQEAKLRQESPANGQSGMHSNSPSVLSYGGSSSVDNYHGQQQSHHVNISYACQPAIVQSSSNMDQSQFGIPYGNSLSVDYPNGPSPSSIYSPYSNASSIWQHQQQKQLQQQQLHQPHSYLSLPPPPPLPPSLSSSSHIAQAINLDDNGLPEYSVVRKIISANISQV
ncbi:uncharacterized protein LOC113789907 isoform X2 [Dermatophagoides pteronyssinus]|uniref:uncharacterized protein LOC113789907 isoform X2 n=1 Tax=Dermatophagoides pteronyssinus TaxID=6956 RepID=UPI003F67C184